MIFIWSIKSDKSLNIIDTSSTNEDITDSSDNSYNAMKIRFIRTKW